MLFLSLTRQREAETQRLTLGRVLLRMCHALTSYSYSSEHLSVLSLTFLCPLNKTVIFSKNCVTNKWIFVEKTILSTCFFLIDTDKTMVMFNPLKLCEYLYHYLHCRYEYFEMPDDSQEVFIYFINRNPRGGKKEA